MAADSHEKIKQELTCYLKNLSDEELKNATKKQCVSYLKQKMDKALVKQNKSIIKSFLMEYVVKYLETKKKKMEKEKECLDDDEENNEMIQNDENSISATSRKRKLDGSDDQNITKQPPMKKRKVSTEQIIETLNQIDTGPIVQSKDVQIHSPQNDDYKDHEMEQPEAECEKSPIQNIEEMVSLIQADNVLSKLNQTLISKQLKNSNKNNVNYDYDSIEHEALKNKLSKCQTALAKAKQNAQKFAALLQPKVKECKQLKDEIEILNKNIEILKNKHCTEMDKLKNTLKNETENVKEERFNALRKDKYIQRMEKKFDFICNKYNIDRDSLVIEMNPP